MKWSLAGLSSKVVTIFLVAAFAIWGVVGLGSAPSGDVVAEIGDEEITISEYKQNLNEYARKSFTMARYLDAEPQKRLEVAETVFQSMLRDRIVEDFATANGLFVPDDMVIEEIKNEKAFKGKKGNFDEAIFEKTLQLSNISREEYINRKKREYVNRMINSAVSFSNNFRISPDAAVPYYRYEHEMRKAKYIVLFASDIDVEIPKDPSVLFNFYNANPHLFSSQELRSFRYINLNKQSIVESWSRIMDVSEEEAEEIYSTKKDFYKIPESVDIRQMVFESQEEAEEFYNQVIENEKEFDKIGRSFKETGVSQLEKVERDHLLQELADYAFSAELGKISKPIQTILGWHVARLIAHYPEFVPPIEEIIEDIKINFTTEKAELRFDSLIRDTQTQMNQSNLNDLAKIFNTVPVIAPLVDSEGYPNEAERERIETPSNLLAHVFEHKQNESVGLIQPVKGNYIAYQIDEVVDSGIETYQEQEVFRFWMEQERLKLNRERGNKIRDQIDTGKTTLEDAARDLNIDLKESEFMTQVSDTALLGDFSPYLRDSVFRMPNDSPISGPGSDKGIWIVAKYSDIKDSEINQASIERISRDLGRDLSDLLMRYYVASMISQTSVRINNSVYEKVLEAATFTPGE